MKWKTLSQIGAAAMLLGFFLPWVSVSCSSQATGGFGTQSASMPLLTFSGFDLASGPKLQTAFGVQQLPASVGLWLVLAAAVGVVVITLVVTAQKPGAVATLVAGLVSVVPLFNTWQSFEQSRTPFVNVSVQLGLWMTLLGLAAVAVGGLIGLGEQGVTRPMAGRRRPSSSKSPTRGGQVKMSALSLPAVAGYAGYLLCIWLILRTDFLTEPVWGFRWSFVALGVLGAFAIAMLRNEWNLRTRLRAFDSGQVGPLACSLAWAFLALASIAAVLTVPRY